MIEGQPFVGDDGIVRRISRIRRRDLPLHYGSQLVVSVDQRQLVLPRLEVSILQQLLRLPQQPVRDLEPGGIVSVVPASTCTWLLSMSAIYEQLITHVRGSRPGSLNVYNCSR